MIESRSSVPPSSLLEAARSAAAYYVTAVDEYERKTCTRTVDGEPVPANAAEKRAIMTFARETFEYTANMAQERYVPRELLLRVIRTMSLDQAMRIAKAV